MARPIMIQGTMSNVGKSLITAGLCRVFKQDGYSVAPFKSQNMALNSFVTDKGLEMGRAQVVQAEACGICPSVAMNPILLKPVTDMGSQVIVNGEVRCNMKAAQYFAYKKNLIPDIMSAYDSLARSYDIIVIEGAGSPPEINLKEDDIVNMGLAEMLQSPVLLVGDIDRGGVFAQLCGTLTLLTDRERSLVKALIVNKFRGDLEILKPGIKMLEEKSAKPVAGVLPLLDVDIEDEDSLTERFSAQKNEAHLNASMIDIAVVRLPKISNFTDFYALEATEGISVRYVQNKNELGTPDMIIIPGTKNTIADLKYLKESGIEGLILRLAEKDKVIFGLCGGYQMLGLTVTDSEGVEIEGGGTIAAMGLLPINTIFTPEKMRKQVKASVPLFGNVEGYEIHMGQSSHKDGTTLPLLVQKNNVFGTYMHGFFDSESAREALCKFFCEKKGIKIDRDQSKKKLFNLKKYKEKQFDILADAVRENLDMKMIYRILKGAYI